MHDGMAPSDRAAWQPNKAHARATTNFTTALLGRRARLIFLGTCLDGRACFVYEQAQRRTDECFVSGMGTARVGGTIFPLDLLEGKIPRQQR